jgi:hypothetical protein
LLDGAAKMIVGQFFTAVNAQLAAMMAPPAPPSSGSGPAPSGAVAPSLTAAPVQISHWRTLVQFVVTQCRDKLRQWFARSV